MTENRTGRRLTVSILIIALLSLCLCITSVALIFSMVSVEDNVFATGSVKINLNDGKPVITEREFLFEPGMTVKKDFFVENESSCDVYYRLYFEDISGGLAELLTVQICDGDRVLYEGSPKALSRENTAAADDILRVAQRRELQIYFYMPEHIGNEGQGLFLSFTFTAEAVQVKNNPDKNFND